jgi:hypothetical protein
MHERTAYLMFAINMFQVSRTAPRVAVPRRVRPLATQAHTRACPHAQRPRGTGTDHDDPWRERSRGAQCCLRLFAFPGVLASLHSAAMPLWRHHAD